MNYSSFSPNRSHRFKPKSAKKPIVLAFGLPPSEIPTPSHVPVEMPKGPDFSIPVVLKGTLHMKNVDLSKTPALNEAHKKRVLVNLNKIFSNHSFQQCSSRIDFAPPSELHVSFPYDQTVIDRIKGLDRNERAWDPEKKVWRVFIGCFDDLFDILGKGFALSEKAFHALMSFVETPYYAHEAKSKLGKLIVRESWYEQIFTPLEAGSPQAPSFTSTLPLLPTNQAPMAAEDLEKIRQVIQKFPFKRKPFAHQLDGIEYLLAHDSAALLDEMGCGKSFQIASAIALLLQQNEIDKVLIVPPKSLIKTWEEELLLANNEHFTVVKGTVTQRKKSLETSQSIVLIHYEGLRIEEKNLENWMKNQRCLIVFDESQRIKNMQAQTTQAAINLSRLASRRIIATGTPITNRPWDLFSQYLAMDQGKTFGTKYSAFKNTFCEVEIQKIKVGRRTLRIEKFVGVRHTEELARRIALTSLRRLKSQVLDLPPVLYKDYIVELSGEQKSMYAQMRDNLKIHVSNLSAEQVASEASNLMVQMLRLVQIASNPLLLNEKYTGPNAKCAELNTLLEDILLDPFKKVIVWSHYVFNIKHLCKEYQEKYGAVGYTGEMSDEERHANVQAFQKDPNTRLFIATPQSAKEGLTLLPHDRAYTADTMIYLDLGFNSGSYMQSQARFHRIGQQAVRCLVIHLMAENSIDNFIRKNLQMKMETAFQVLDQEYGGQDHQPLHSSSTNFSDTTAFTKDQLLSIL